MKNEAVNIKIVPENSELTNEEKKIVNETIGNKKVYNKEDYIPEVDNDNEEEIISKIKEKEEYTEETLSEQTTNVLNKFKAYIQSDNFEQKTKKYADKYNLKHDLVKNTFLKNILGFIGKTLHVIVHTTGNIIHAGVLFIDNIIKNITKFSVYSLDKVIDFITLNCAIDYVG